METVCFSETLASTYESTRRQNTKEHHHYHPEFSMRPLTDLKPCLRAAGRATVLGQGPPSVSGKSDERMLPALRYSGYGAHLGRRLDTRADGVARGMLMSEHMFPGGGTWVVGRTEGRPASSDVLYSQNISGSRPYVSLCYHSDITACVYTTCLVLQS
jgi:hypothetical protein